MTITLCNSHPFTFYLPFHTSLRADQCPIQSHVPSTCTLGLDPCARHSLFGRTDPYNIDNFYSSCGLKRLAATLASPLLCNCTVLPVPLSTGPYLGSGDSATNTSKLPLVLPFDHINRKVLAIIHKNAKILSEDESIGSIFDGNIITAYKRTSNLKDLFVRSRISQAVIPGTFPCGRARCVTCLHIHHTTEIVGPSGSTQIKDSFSCTSQNVVYVIVCLKCGELYAGETGRMLAERFREHLGDVRHARPNKEVAAHFNLPGHSLDDISVTGVLTRSEMIQRRLLETKLIRRLGTLLPQGMNREEDLFSCVSSCYLSFSFVVPLCSIVILCCLLLSLYSFVLYIHPTFPLL